MKSWCLKRNQNMDEFTYRSKNNDENGKDKKVQFLFFFSLMVSGIRVASGIRVSPCICEMNSAEAILMGHADNIYNILQSMCRWVALGFVIFVYNSKFKSCELFAEKGMKVWAAIWWKGCDSYSFIVSQPNSYIVTSLHTHTPHTAHMCRILIKLFAKHMRFCFV